LLVSQAQNNSISPVEAVIPAVKKTAFRNRKSNPYTKPSSTNKLNLKENLTPIYTKKIATVRGG